ncbi:putative transcription factor bHLH family [Helianthus annuus]|nr:putative transcription factor bHLH family [Helianthus annuus]
MEMAQEWFPELVSNPYELLLVVDLSEMEGQILFMTEDEMKNLYDTTDNIIVDSVSSESYKENMRLIDQSIIQTQQHENDYQEKSGNDMNKSSQTPEPLVASIHPLSNTLTISFGNINPINEPLQLPDLLGYEAAYTTKVPTTARNHVLAERKRREKLNQHFISLSALLPNLKKVTIISYSLSVCSL